MRWIVGALGQRLPTKFPKKLCLKHMYVMTNIWSDSRLTCHNATPSHMSSQDHTSLHIPWSAQIHGKGNIHFNNFADGYYFNWKYRIWYVFTITCECKVKENEKFICIDVEM